LRIASAVGRSALHRAPGLRHLGFHEGPLGAPRDLLVALEALLDRVGFVGESERQLAHRLVIELAMSLLETGKLRIDLLLGRRDALLALLLLLLLLDGSQPLLELLLDQCVEVEVRLAAVLLFVLDGVAFGLVQETALLRHHREPLVEGLGVLGDLAETQEVLHLLVGNVVESQLCIRLPLLAEVRVLLELLGGVALDLLEFGLEEGSVLLGGRVQVVEA
jgi:hypothetical protein